MIKNDLEEIRKRAIEIVTAAVSPAELEDIRVRFLGKKGELTAILRQMGGLSAEERPMIGQLANLVREEIEARLEECGTSLREVATRARIASESIDVTAPGLRLAIGTPHPLSIVEDQVCEIFSGMGYIIADGPEVEFDYYNFEALNIPKDHPARDTQDTFYVSDNIVLRTQTSPMQIRYMEKNKPPVRMICPGRVYRSDAVDATHSPMFHQIEGLAVEEGITLGDLKGTLEVFAKRFYGDDIAVRFRPHHFPFTEPSAEMDVSCFNCHGKGCSFCKGEGWIEILGAGMVHPRVLENCGIDSTKYTGFAFGMGVERLCLLRYKINDMRLLFENDLRFLGQFRGV